MKEFFIDNYITIPFKLFGKTHMFLMLFVLTAFIIIYLKRNKLNSLNIKIKKRITVLTSIVLLVNMLVLYISSIYYKCFNYQTMLPLHLCYIANYLYIICILLKKYNLLKYSYFLSVLGPLPAIIFFDVPSVWESFNFYLYIISHHFLIIMSFITFYLYPSKITKKDVLKLYVNMNIIFIIICIFNNTFKTNYFFSKGIPIFIKELLPFLKYIPDIITLEIMEIILIYLLYLYYKREYKYLRNIKNVL